MGCGANNVFQQNFITGSSTFETLNLVHILKHQLNLFKDFCVLPELCESFMTISKIFHTAGKYYFSQQLISNIFKVIDKNCRN